MLYNTPKEDIGFLYLSSGSKQEGSHSQVSGLPTKGVFQKTSQ